uniref:Cyclin G2 n=1 Tax=Sphaeramia orbicularis TaxID=375764 RepID=A0A672ZV94_9TELE
MQYLFRDMDAFKLMKELKTNYEQEVYYLPKEAGLSLIESTTQDDSRISAKCRDAKVEDLWSLTSFFGYSAQTFVLAVNLLDRFLAMMRVRHTHTSDRQDPQNLSCVSLSCLHMAAKVTEEECNLTPTDELIRIGQCRFTVSDLGRMEKIIAEKLDFKSRAVTALTFLHLYHQIAQSHCTERTETLSLDKLEAQLKACLCRISFSKAKPSVLALSLLRQDIEAVCSEDLLEITCHIQRHLKIAEAELLLWSERVAQCLSDYAAAVGGVPQDRPEPAQLQDVPELPTIPEGCWTRARGQRQTHTQSQSGSEPVKYYNNL